MVLLLVGQIADPVQTIVVAIVAIPVGLLGVAGLKVKLLVIVTVQVIVSPPTEPVLLHWSTLPLVGSAATEAVRSLAAFDAEALAARRMLACRARA